VWLATLVGGEAAAEALARLIHAAGSRSRKGQQQSELTEREEEKKRKNYTLSSLFLSLSLSLSELGSSVLAIGLSALTATASQCSRCSVE
jgi:hypothetical protein